MAAFGDKYVEMYGNCGMPAYIHIVVCHSVALISMHGSIGVHQNQGVEAVRDLGKDDAPPFQVPPPSRR